MPLYLLHIPLLLYCTRLISEAGENDNFKEFDLHFGTQSLLPDGYGSHSEKNRCWESAMIFVPCLMTGLIFFTSYYLHNCFVQACFVAGGWGRPSCWDRKWRTMWEGWKRVPSALTSQFQWPWLEQDPNEAWPPFNKTILSRDLVHIIIMSVDSQVWYRGILTLLIQRKDNGTMTEVVPPPTTPWGARSHLGHPNTTRKFSQVYNLPTTSQA